MEYKCVAAPRDIVIDAGGSSEKAVSSFANSINSESKDGWKFFSLENIKISEFPNSRTFNMLIFCKEE